MVRAKFRCTSITKLGEQMNRIELSPVTSGSNENKQFFTATPWGQISLGCANDAATAKFEVDKEYYIDFSPAN